MLAVKLLGQFDLRLDGIAIDLPSRTEQSLLAYLILNTGTSFRREQLAGMLWPDSAETNAKSSLRHALWRLRKTLREASLNNSDYLLSNKINLSFNQQLPFWVDTLVLEKGRGQTPQELLEETAVYQGELLPGFYDDWILLERERLRTVFDRKMHRLLQCLIDEKSWEGVIEQSERWISMGETPEPAFRALMVAYASLGDKGKALTTFMRCLDALEHELGVGPADETVQLEKRIRAGEPLFPTAGQKGLHGYELRERLGQGSFGTVFSAVHAATGREVAVKVILPEYVNDPDFIRRFEFEAQSIARLEHPFIVPLYDYWRQPDGAYLVTRLLKGGSLQQALEFGPFDLERSVSLVEQLASGLFAAHQHGLVHQRLKPSDILFDEAGHAYLYDLGIANLLDGFDRHPRVTSPYTAPEMLRNEPPTPQADVYSLGMILFRALTGELPRQPSENGNGRRVPSIRAWRPEIPESVDLVIQRATAANPAQRYADALSLAADFREAANTALKTKAAIVEKPLLTGIANPYKGLAAFDEADAPFFFGREVLVQRFVDRMSEDHPLARFLAVVGPSGSGKSSLVKAGLIPALRAGALPGSDEWFVLKMTPGSHPFEELEINLLRISDNPSLNLMEQLRRDERGLLRAVRLALPGDDCQLLLVIDQFEEVFTLVEDKAELERFLEGLYIASLDRRSPLRVVVTLRADFYDRPLMHDNFSKLVQERTEVVVPMTARELERAVSAPARLVGVALDPDLVNAMVLDGKEHPDALPLLQYALTELFERRTGSTLTLEKYQSMGGVEGLLERSAEEVYERLEPGEQELARQLFLRLVTLGEGVEDTRRRVLRSELEALHPARLATPGENSAGASALSGIDPGTMAQVIDRFGKARLLSFDLDPLTRTPTVEITHEALLGEWPRLRAWLDDGRADVRTQRALAGAAAEWVNAGRDSSFLLHGVRLSQFESWSGETSLALTGQERAYLDASLEQRQAQRKAEEERRARLAALERRSRNFLRALVVVLLMASLASLTLAGLARQAQAQATSRELTAVAINTIDEDPELSILLSLAAMRIADTGEAEDALRHSLRSSRLRMRLVGHDARVDSVHFSPDGSMIVSSSYDKNDVILWQTNSGQELDRLPGRIARFSPDGSHLAVGSNDSNVYLYDTTTWEILNTMRGHSEFIQDLHFNPQGTLLASASLDDTFSVWEVSSGKQVFSGPAFVGGYYTLDNVVFSPDGKYLFAADWHGGALTAEYTGMMRVYQAEQDWALLNEYPSADMVFNISPDGRWLVSPGEDTFTAILMRDISTLSGEDLTAVSLSEIEPRIVSEAHGNVIFKFTFNQDGNLMASAGDSKPKIWDITGVEPELLTTLAGHGMEVVDIAFSPDSHQVATASLDGIVRVWDITLAGVSEGLALDAHRQRIRRFEFTPNGDLLATASLDGTAKLWNPASGELLLTIDDSDSELFGVAISPDGKRLATAAFDHKTRVYDLESASGGVKAELVHILAGHDQNAQPVGALFEGIIAIAFSPDGNKLATGGADGFAKVWQVEAGEELLSIQAHPSGVGITNLAFSPDSKYLATTSDQDVISNVGSLAKIWDAESGEELVAYEGHIESDRIWGLAFSPDGDRMATSGSILKVWDRSTGTEIFEFGGHTGTIGGLVFSQDGKYLASASVDGTARLWDASTGETIQRFFAPGSIFGAAFSPDEKYLVVSGDGFIYGFVLDRDELVNQAYSRLTRWFTPQECLQYLHSETCPAPPPGTRFASPAY
jgi:WD40 repeat protein/DNA-binding SARP family transcriptional activator